MAEGCKDKPIDNAIIGIVDSVSLDQPLPPVPTKDKAK